MRIGKRKMAALLGLLVVVALGVGAYLLWETDGLLALTLATVGLSAAGLGWLTVGVERRLRRQLDHKHNEQARMIRDELQRNRSETAAALNSAGISGQQSEQLLRAMQAAFRRLEAEWQASFDELRDTVSRALTEQDARANRGSELLQREIAVAGREMGAASGAISGLTDRVDSTVSDVAALADATRSAYEQLDATVRSEFARQTRKETMANFRRLIDESVSEIDALLQLRQRFAVSGKEPVLGGWAIGPGALLYMLERIDDTNAQLVVECGPGASTIFIAEHLRRRGAGRVVGLEHSPDFHDVVSRQIVDRGLSEFAEIRLAPLVETTFGDDPQMWYDPTAVEDLANIDLLLIDGPPQSTNDAARYPAGPVFDRRLAPGALIVLDDAHRAGEQAARQRWRDELGWVEEVTPPGGFVALRRTSSDGGRN